MMLHTASKHRAGVVCAPLHWMVRRVLPDSSGARVQAGRQTGSEGWRAARGEVGSAGGAAVAVEGPQGTRWRLVKADGQLKGALVRASGENEPGETADKVRHTCSVTR